MKKVLLGILIGALGMYAYERVRAPARVATIERSDEQPGEQAAEPLEVANQRQFHCDGRVYCSEMTSCDEATYFLQNCPGVKMDGEGDGMPCEQQWCGDRR
jgi:hypothetical protein